MRHSLGGFGALALGVVLLAGGGCDTSSITVLESPPEAPTLDATCIADAEPVDAPGPDAPPPDASRPPLGGTWPTFAHDFQRTARSEGVGEMRAPEVAWTKRMGGALTSEQGFVADADGDGRPEVITISAGRVTVTRADGSNVWQGGLVGARAVLGVWDLDGAGAPEVVVDTTGGVLVLDGASGQVLASFSSAQPANAAFVPLGDRGGLLVTATSRGPLSAYDFRSGTNVTAPLWTITGANQTTVLARDVDGDGALDLVRPLDYGFEVDDPLTGATKYALEGAEIGGQAAYFYLWQMANVDGLPGDEIIAVDTSYLYSPSAGIIVLGVRAGALTKLWSRRVETGQPLATDFYTVGGAVADLDGDGAIEVVFSQWDSASSAWTTYVADGATGSIVGEIPSAFVQAVGDIDGDGRAEIVARSTPLGDRTPARTDLRAYDFDARATGPVAKPWTRPRARAVFVSSGRRSGPWAGVDVPVLGAFDASPGLDLVVADDPTARGADARVALLRGADGTSERSIPLAEGITASVLGWGDRLSSATSTNDLVTFTDDGVVQVRTGELAARATFPAGTYANWVNVYGLDDTSAIIASTTSTGELQWIDGTHLDAAGEPYVRHRLANVSRTSFDAASGVPHEPMVLLPGASPTLVAFQEGETALTLVAHDAIGVEVWRTTLAPSTRPARPEAYAADVTGDGVTDLIVPLINLHSLESIAIFDGKNGALVRSTPLRSLIDPATVTSIGALIDVNEDATPDLVIPVSNVGVVAINLRTNPLTPLWKLPITPEYDTRGGAVGAGKLTDARPFDLFKVGGGGGGGKYLRLSPDGQVEAASDQWMFPDRTADRNSVALVRRGPGLEVFDLALAGSDYLALSRVRKLAGDSFAELWTRYVADGVVTDTPPPRGYTLRTPLGLDIDGDGEDEIVFGSDDGRVYALRSADGAIAFSVDLGAPVQHVIAADIDRDPAVELLAFVADGRLVALDEPGHYVAVRDRAPDDASVPEAGPCDPEEELSYRGQQNGGCACRTGGSAKGGLPALLGIFLAAACMGRRRRVRRG